jgi:tetratricopeptide (TPR) repeat protein
MVLDENSLRKLGNCYEEAKKYLNHAAEYNLYFPNVYYKKAQLLIYYIIYNNKISQEEKNNVYAEIKELLENAKQINETAQGIFFIERMYYDVLGDFAKAQRINEQVRKFNPKNAENWEAAYNEYINDGI